MKNEALQQLTEKRKRERKTDAHWISVSFVQDLTGWDKSKLRMARNQNIVQWRKGKGGILYLLESIPEQFLKKVV